MLSSSEIVDILRELNKFQVFRYNLNAVSICYLSELCDIALHWRRYSCMAPQHVLLLDIEPKNLLAG
jgi:hypothetical protein